MPTLTLWQINLCAWYLLLIAWGIGALKNKPVKATEPSASRLLYGICFVSGFVLLFSNTLPLGGLRQRFLPRSEWIGLVGIVLSYAGAAIAIWASFILADNWSARITVKIGHELIRSGPYAYVRHPIYSGILLSVVGTALLVSEWRALLAIVLVAISFTMKAKREEAYMTAEFGDLYSDYQQGTGFLLPKV